MQGVQNIFHQNKPIFSFHFVLHAVPSSSGEIHFKYVILWIVELKSSHLI